MASNNLTSSYGANGTSAEMNLDVWRLILDQIDSRADLCNVCLTSRAWFTMAMPHLYKVVPLRMRRYQMGNSEMDLMLFAHSLSSRLLDTKNETLRNAVHELDFGEFPEENESEMENRLVALVDSLPNLQRVKIRSPLTQEALRCLAEHSQRISLHLLREDGRRCIEDDCNLQSVVSLAAQVDPHLGGEGPNRDVLGLQELLFACPNLKSLSIKIHQSYGGCVITMPHPDTVYSFQLSGDEKFPSLVELSLDGYSLSGDEWEHWAERFQWSKLKSLTLGPQYTANFLEQAKGYATFLRHLEVKVYTDADRSAHCHPLTDFLASFTSLESLTVKGYWVPVVAIRNHPGLKHLCLHSFEQVRVNGARLELDVQELQEIDKSCPHLETLEFDLFRDHEWPEEILKPLAMGFKSLRRLTVHLEIGLWEEGWRGSAPFGPQNYIRVEPILDKDSAREVGQQFFKWRSSSNLNVLIFKTGEPLRRYPQWEPSYCVFERSNAKTIKVYKPRDTGGVPEVVIMAQPS
ncbi:hypothetical protein GGR51DRAFT_469999 [Nemania sp. FL0031]|nr:hypothetical protein GGR51DRAFT_469999 [Nemania sp. FL0031]